MRGARARLVLAIVETDRTFERRDVRGEQLWVGRCIHCSSALTVGPRGETYGATVEHIVARTHGGTDAIENVALACARCNHGKGVRLDRRRRDDPRVREVQARMLARRRERWRGSE
ncbi:MAG: HNH endonuclease [Myxococcota bacterium]|nr:HNH endonuclease [Myxococcota bacterium]